MSVGGQGLLVVLGEEERVDPVESNSVAVPNCTSGTWKVRMS